MCLSNNRDQNRPVTFDDTILLSAEHVPAGNADDSYEGVEHVLGYFNRVSVAGSPADEASPVKRRSGSRSFGWGQSAASPKKAASAKPRGNAMLLAVPAVPGTITADSLVPVSSFPNFMKDFKRAVVPPAPKSRGGLRRGRTLGSDSNSEPVVISGFDSDTYDVVIARNAKDIKKVIGKVSEAKRPAINTELYAELDKWCAGWTFLLFCFTEDENSKAGCAVVKYEPLRPDLLYAPGLDGHTGKIELGDVEINHTLIFSSNRMAAGKGKKVSFTDPGLRAAHPYFHDRVIGGVFANQMVPQGDFVCAVEDVRNGEFHCKRELPPGAPAKLQARDEYYL